MKRYLLIAICMVTSMLVFAQKNITGKITDTKGNAVSFATITVKGQNKSVTSDADGKFEITNVSPDGILVITSQGYLPTELAANSNSPVSIILENSVNSLKEVVVVSALGISRTKRSVGYATQQLSADKITTTKVADINTAIAGKIAGTQIRGGSGAKFGTSSIRLRGINTLGGGNPIYVVDGVITNSTGVNPEDVESLNVLKGPAASALYGQRGSEGAIIITTKKGSTKGLGVEFNHATIFENVYVLPDYQNEYGGGASQDWLTFTFNPLTMPAKLSVLNGAKYYRYDVDESWGPKMDGTLYAPWYAWDSTDNEFGKLKPFTPQPNNVRNFFNTGVTNNTSVALRMIKTEDVNIAKVAFAEAITAGIISSNTDNAIFKYLSNANYEYPWYTNYTRNGRYDYGVSKTLIDKVVAFNDPRLPVFARKTINTATYEGAPYGENAYYDLTDYSLLGRSIYAQNAPLQITTYAQMCFTMAEAALQGWIPGGDTEVSNWYNKGIDASMDQWSAVSTNPIVTVTTAQKLTYRSQASIIIDPINILTLNQKLERIQTQKWLNFYMNNGHEAWAEWRRTGYPILLPAVNPLNADGKIPRRQCYPQTEKDLNGVNYAAAIAQQGADELSTRLWWDRP